MRKLIAILTIFISTTIFAQNIVEPDFAEIIANDSIIRIKQSLYKSCKIASFKEFMTEYQFEKELSDSQKEEINQRATKEWINSFDDKEKADIALSNYQLSKKHLVSWSPNKYGYQYGVGASVSNNSGKTIKYVIFKLISINSVGDPIARTEKKVNGPTPDGEYGSWTLDVAGLTDLVNQNNEINSIRVISFTVEYTDLTRLDINDIQKSTIDSDLMRRMENIRMKLEIIKESLIIEMYRVAKVKHNEELEKLILSQKNTKDSLDIVIEQRYINILTDIYRKNFKRINRFNETARKTSLSIIELSMLDKKKKKFIQIMYGLPVDNIKPYSKRILNLIIDNKKLDTTSLKGLKEYCKKNDNVSDIFKITDLYAKNNNLEERKALFIIYDTIVNKLAKDQDFIYKPLRKTNLYRENQEEYKEKEIKSIIPINKHIGLMYVYGGGKSPYGINIAVYPKNNLGIYFEYLTQPQIYGLTNDNTQDYPDAKEADILFNDIKEKNIYKLEDTWDKSYKTINIGLNIPVNYKRNILIGLGIGRTTTTEYKRYELPKNFSTISMFGVTDAMKEGSFYLDSDKRINYNLTYNANIIFILKPITIKIGATVNDKDRKDTRINFGIGLTF